MEKAVAKDGYIKVLLYYVTARPKNNKALTMKKVFEIQGPYPEDVIILVPKEKTFDMLPAFEDYFQKLKDAKIIDETGLLREFHFLSLDDTSLGIVIDTI